MEEHSDAWKLGYTDKIEAGINFTSNPFSVGTPEHDQWNDGYLGASVKMEQDEFLADVICTAVEGGIQYWALATGYEWEFRSMGHKLDYASVVVMPTDDDRNEQYSITMDSIREALERIARPVPGMSIADRKAILGSWAVLDAGDIDADLADQIVQVACFGEVIYG